VERARSIMDLLFNYSHYENWERNAALGWYGPQSVTFDGENRIIYVNQDVTSLNVQADLYSNWKEWVRWEGNSTYAPAFTAIGGDPISATDSLGITYFLENGWRIKPYEGDYVLTIVGNIYTRESGQNPILPTSGVSVSLTRSNIVDQPIVNVTSSAPTAEEVADEVETRFDIDANNRVRAYLDTEATFNSRIQEIWRILGLDAANIKNITDASITVGGITLTISQPNANTTTVSRTT
jgi:hypothetical protein